MIPLGSTKNGSQVTDSMAGLPQKVTDLSYDELCRAHELYWSSRILHNLDNVMELMKEPGYRLNKFEIEAIEKFISEYSLLYKSPLAEALKE
jgi:hypothetical protein